MKKITVSILTTLLMLSMVFSSSVFAANEEVSAWDSFLGLLGINASETTDVVGVEYRGHIQNKGDYPLDPATWVQGPNRLGTVGEALRLEGFWIQLTNKPADVNIKYQVHVQNEGWMEPVLNGKFAGTEAKSQRIEAIKIWLVDDAGEPVTGYSVEYRGHVENVGDVPETAGDWYADGFQLGTVAASQRLEALEVRIVKTQADMTAYDAAVVAAAELTEDDYTAESWEVLTDALAVEVTADNTQAEVDAATAAIQIATGALVFANQADLDAAKLAVADLVEADYTAESWAAIAPALELPETTNAEVGAKALALGTAYADLVFAGQADLDAVVAEAAELEEADYTPATWAALAEALELPETTNAEVVAKTAAITEAIAGLVEVANMEAYDAIVAAAGEVVEADYTAATYAALQTALEENVVTNLDTQEDVDAATAAINAAIDGLELIPKIASVEATGAKILTVTFNKPVDDTKAVLSVVKSTIKQNMSKTTWASDKQSVAIELSAKLIKGQYTVNVTGITESALTANVTVENETVNSIEILSDIAVVNTTASPTTATVGYQVKNQYGEDITKTTALTTNDNTNITTNPATGIVTLSNLNTQITGGYKVGDKLPITLINTASAKSATKVVTLSAAASVSDVTIKGVYNKDGKILNEGTVLTTDLFYLLVDLKDQYGNPITNTTLASSGLIKSETNPTVVTTAGSGSAVTTTSLTIDGKTQLGIQVNAPGGGLKAGESQVTLISTTTGKNASSVITVAETTRTDVVNLSAPALAVANEDILVPVSVLDKTGAEVTDLTVLNNATKGVKVTYNASNVTTPFIKSADGTLYIKVPASSNTADGVFPLVAQSSTYKVSTLAITVEKAAVPTTIRGLKTPLTLAASTTKTVVVDDLIIEDQYGRTMKTAAVTTYLQTNNKGILIEKSNPTATVVTLPSGGVANQTIVFNTGVVVTAGAANGSETITFTLAANNGTAPVLASVAEASVRVTNGTEYSSYEIATIGKVQASDVEAAGDKAFTVNGILNGGKVALVQDTDFTATITGGIAGGSPTVTGGEISVATTDLNVDSAGDQIDTEFTLKVTINATGTVIEQKFTVSDKVKKVEDFFFTNAATGGSTAYTSATTVSKALLASGQEVSTLTKLTDLDGTQITLGTIDQYGNKNVVAVPTTAIVTIIPEKVTDVTIADNGTTDAIATLNSGITEAKVTLRIQVGNAVKDIETTVKL